MALTRRNFLRWAALSTVGGVACNFFPERELTIQSPADLPEDLVSGLDNWYATLCRQCPEAEGIIVRVMEGRAKKVQGNPIYPINTGKQSVRCEAGLQALYHPDRISKPLRRVGSRGSGQFEPIADWNEATQDLVNRLKAGRDTGMLMITEPLYGHLAMVVDRFVQSYKGEHLAFEALEQTVLRATMKRLFDQDHLPDYDIENSQYILSFGADFLSTWLSPVRYARGYGQFRQGQGRSRGNHVHVDPRFSMTAANADEWVPIKPGTEGLMALSMAYVIMSERLADDQVIEAMTDGKGPSALEAFAPDKVVDALEIPTLRGEKSAEIIRRIAREFATRRPSLAIGGGEAAAHTNGHLNLLAIYSLNFLVGSVGQKGGIIFNPSPPLEELAVKPKIGSLEDWRTVSQRLGRGDIKLLMVHGANPVHGLPTADGLDLRKALDRDDLFIVSFSSFNDDITSMADLVLPDRMSMEEWGDEVPEPGPGYQVVGIQQPVVNPLSSVDPRSFPDLLLTLAQELGSDMEQALPWDSFQEVLKEGARKLFQLDRGSIQAPTFEAFWNRLLQKGGWWDTEVRYEGDMPRPTKISVSPNQMEPSFSGPTGQDTFYLIPFLSNSMLEGRGAHLPWLQGAPDPVTSVVWDTWLEMNTATADAMDLNEGDVVLVESPEIGSVEVPVYLNPATPPTVVCMPLGQGHTSKLMYADRDGEQRGVNPLTILAAQADRETGALAWAATRVRVSSTGRNMRVPKFEGIVPAFPVSKEEAIVKVTRG